MKKIFFTPGPSQIYPTVAGHVSAALEQQIPSISHRSQAFMDIYRQTDAALRELLGIPDDFRIWFMGSATEIWERLGQNCVGEQSFHFVNGSFSSRFHKIVGQLGKKPLKAEVPFGEGFEVNQVEIPDSAELISITLNETSSGVQFPVEDISLLRRRYPHMILAADSVSTLPYANPDYTQLDCIYFSVQKAFGLPAGLGVMIANERCLEKARQLEARGLSTGSYHRLTSLEEKYRKFQTPETPNVLGIYLLGKVAQDMLSKGVETIRQETEAKAALLYDFFKNHPDFEPLVKKEAHRSKTVVVLRSSQDPAPLMQRLAKDHFVIGSGYGPHKKEQIRIANFPAHGVADVKALLGKF